MKIQKCLYVRGLINHLFWKLLSQAHHYRRTLLYPTPVISPTHRLLIPASFHLLFNHLCLHQGNHRGQSTSFSTAPLLNSMSFVSQSKEILQKIKTWDFSNWHCFKPEPPTFWLIQVYLLSMGTPLSWSGVPQEDMGECNPLYLLVVPQNWVGQYGTNCVICQTRTGKLGTVLLNNKLYVITKKNQKQNQQKNPKPTKKIQPVDS